MTKTRTKTGSGDPDPYKGLTTMIHKKNKKQEYLQKLVFKPTKIQESSGRTTLSFVFKNKSSMTVKFTWNKTKDEYQGNVYIQFVDNMYFATDDISSLLNHVMRSNKLLK